MTNGAEPDRPALPLKMLVVGDSYMPISIFASAFGELEERHELTYLQLDETLPHKVSDGAARRIREYAGTPDEVRAQIASAEVLIVHCAPVTSEVISAGSRLRLVCCARGGPVNVDIDALARHSVPLVTTPGKNAQAVAELTIGLLVALARGVVSARDAARDDPQLHHSVLGGAAFLGSELNGSSLGLIGLGNVGSRVAAAASALGMDVHGYDPYAPDHGLPGVRPARLLDDLLRAGDFISLHARATHENAGMIDGPAFAAMKPGAFLVNTARETLVDEQALEHALASGHLGGAALDVIEPRLDRPHPLAQFKNVLLTPHIGGATRETLARGAQMIADEVERFVTGAPLRNVIEPERVAT